MNKNLGFIKIFNICDKTLFIIGLLLLFLVVFSSTKMNIVTDSIDYYVILQRLTSAHEEPIVRNLHFADKRSPGYSILSLIPYSIISIFIEPVVKTEEISEYNFNNQKPEPNLTQGSEAMIIPPIPLLINNFLFKNYYIPHENSWYQWKLSLALIVTSITFLIIGIIAISILINHYFQEIKGFSIIPLTIFCSPVFIRNIIDCPLYATLTAFGLSSLFLLFLCNSFDMNKRWQIILTGIVLGFLVLTRLELSIILILLFGYYLFTKRFYFLMYTLVGGLIPLSIYILYNSLYFGTPLYLGILKEGMGGINILRFDIQYIFENMLHPQSGILFWTPILIPGLILLIVNKKNRILKFVGIVSFILIIFYILRIPIMYYNVGQCVMNIGGIPVTPPSNAEQMRNLIRSDINRYISVLIPFAIIGIRLGISQTYWSLRKKVKSSVNIL